MRYAKQSLAEACYVATRGDPELALLLALDIQRIAAVPRWPLEEGAGTKGARGGGSFNVENLTPGASPRGTVPPSLLEDGLAA